MVAIVCSHSGASRVQCKWDRDRAAPVSYFEVRFMVHPSILPKKQKRTPPAPFPQGLTVGWSVESTANTQEPVKIPPCLWWQLFYIRKDFFFVQMFFSPLGCKNTWKSQIQNTWVLCSCLVVAKNTWKSQSRIRGCCAFVPSMSAGYVLGCVQGNEISSVIHPI